EKIYASAGGNLVPVGSYELHVLPSHRVIAELACRFIKRYWLDFLEAKAIDGGIAMELAPGLSEVKWHRRHCYESSLCARYARHGLDPVISGGLRHLEIEACHGRLAPPHSPK